MGYTKFILLLFILFWDNLSDWDICILARLVAYLNLNHPSPESLLLLFFFHFVRQIIMIRICLHPENFILFFRGLNHIFDTNDKTFYWLVYAVVLFVYYYFLTSRKIFIHEIIMYNLKWHFIIVHIFLELGKFVIERVIDQRGAMFIGNLRYILLVEIDCGKLTSSVHNASDKTHM